MRTDREWMYNRLVDGRRYVNPEFLVAVESFVEYACHQPTFMDGDKIRCPCCKCQNRRFLLVDEVKLHLTKNGFVKDYYQWVCHGESLVMSNHMQTRSNSSFTREAEGSNPFVNMVIDGVGSSLAPTDKVLSLREASQTISQSGNDNSPPIDEVTLYYQAVGGEKKRTVYGLGSQASYYCGGSTNANKSTASSSETQNQEKLQSELTTVYERLESQENLIVDLRRTIEMLCNHIGMPPPHPLQNATNSQPEEGEGARNGEDGDDPRLT